MADITRVLLAIQVRLYREGLADVLSNEPGIAVVGVARDGEEAVERSAALRPDVILLDCGIDCSLRMVRRLHEAHPEAHIVALGLSDSEPDVMCWAQAGITGYVSRDGTREELVASIRAAATGEFVCSPRVAALLLRRVAASAPEPRDAEGLTRRERQVMELMGEDLSNKAIATRLNIELSTVKNHVHHVLEKLGLRHRAQLLRRSKAPPVEGSRSPDSPGTLRF